MPELLRPKRDWTPAQMAAFASMWGANKPAEVIGGAFGIRPVTVYQRASKMGLKRRVPRGKTLSGKPCRPGVGNASL